MTNTIRATLLACGCAGTVVTAAPALAQMVVIGPYPYVRSYGAYAGPYGPYVYGRYVGPYGAYGYHRFGFDPDPNVQFEISRTRNWRKG